MRFTIFNPRPILRDEGGMAFDCSTLEFFPLSQTRNSGPGPTSTRMSECAPVCRMALSTRLRSAFSIKVECPRTSEAPFPIDYDVGYNNQDAIVSRQLMAHPTPAGKLCYIRFDLIGGEGDYAYGFKPPELGPSAPDEWGVWVKKRGTVLSRQRSVLKMNAVYFYVDGPKGGAANEICARKQTVATPQEGHGYTAKEWSSLIVRARLIHG